MFAFHKLFLEVSISKVGEKGGAFAAKRKKLYSDFGSFPRTVL
jgi:hypothetical protein